MLEATDAPSSHDLRIGRRPNFNGATLRRISEYSVNTLRVVVTDIVAEESAQVLLIEHNHVIDDFSLARSHPALRRSVLPGTVKRASLRFYIKILDRFCDLAGENRVIVVDQILRSGVIGKGLA